MLAFGARSWERCDRIRAAQSAVDVFVRPVVWVLLLWLALAAMFWPVVSGIGQTLLKTEAFLSP